MVIEMPATKYIKAHIKKCNLCRKHDRHVGSGEGYTDKELATYRDHMTATRARIKLAIEDEEVQGKVIKIS